MYDIETKLCSKNAWFTPTESDAYYKARYSREGITIHWWGGGESADKHDAIVDYFVRQSEQGVKSVNYVVSDGKITMMVDPDNVAWCSHSGNPTTISIECQPTLGDEGYKRLGWLIARLEYRYNHHMNLYPHKHWVNTDCPGTISIDRARAEADVASSAGLAAAPQPAPSPAQSSTPTTEAAADKVFLPSSVDRWRLYPEDAAPVIGNEKAFLRPALFAPGLTYEILGRPQTNVVTIQTQDFGRGNIWVGPDTEAQFISGNPVQVSSGDNTQGRKLFLPGSVDTWRVYPLDLLPRIGNECALLRPAMFGGLTYDILDTPYPNVYTIQTQDFGKVNIYAGPDTEAQFN